MPVEFSDRVRVIDHPLAQDRLGRLRDKETPTLVFRLLLKDLAMYLGYEALRNLPLLEVEIETPLETTRVKCVTSTSVCFVPVLRAGLGMLDAALSLVPDAKVGFIGLERKGEDHRPKQYLCKLPSDIARYRCLVLDPMLATGGSLMNTVGVLREYGVKDIDVLTVLSAREGVEALLAYDEGLRLFTCAIDPHLDANAYIRPGLGDAGDRIFGTELP